MKTGIHLAAAMMLPLAHVAAPTLASAQFAGMAPVRTIELRGAGEIADASAVKAAFSLLVQRAQSCPESNMKARNACVCRLKPELASLGSAYSSAILKHPAWKLTDTVVTYAGPRSGQSTAIVFSNVKRQLDLCPGH